MNSSLPLTSHVKKRVHSRSTNAACSSESAPTANSRGSTCFPKKNVTVSTFLMDMIKSVIGVDTSLFYVHDDHHSGLSKQDLLYSLTWLTSMLALILSMFLCALSHIANHTTVGGPGIVNTCECFFSNSCSGEMLHLLRSSVTISTPCCRLCLVFPLTRMWFFSY